ncbi:hypothetical protein T06_15156 [Trichinella sp. T6]|nr:hypothetical protein T06_15156 [Trichinella sp. T6]
MSPAFVLKIIRTFFKVKHSMELGFLKTTRSCCHNEICTYIFQSNHQQMSMTVCRQLEHCEQLFQVVSMMMAGNGGLQVSMRIAGLMMAGNGGLQVSVKIAGMVMAGNRGFQVSMMMAGNGGFQVSMVMAGNGGFHANFQTAWGIAYSVAERRFFEK